MADAAREPPINADLPLSTDFPIPPSTRISVLEASPTARVIEYPLCTELTWTGCGLVAAVFALVLAAAEVLWKETHVGSVGVAIESAVFAFAAYFVYRTRVYAGARCRVTMERGRLRIERTVSGKCSAEDFRFDGKGEAKLAVSIVVNDLPQLSVAVRHGRRSLTLGDGLSLLEQTWITDRLNEVLDPASESTINNVELAPPQDSAAAEEELRKGGLVEVSRANGRGLRIGFQETRKEALPILAFFLIGVAGLLLEFIWAFRFLVGWEAAPDLTAISLGFLVPAAFTAFGFHALKDAVFSIEIDEEHCVTRSGIQHLRYTRRLKLQKIAQISVVIARARTLSVEKIHQVLCLLSDGKEIGLSPFLSKPHARAVASLVHAHLLSAGREVRYIEGVDPS